MTCTQTSICYAVHLMVIIIKNIVSHNQLDEWRHFAQTIDELESEMDDVNEYYECLIDCQDTQSVCKRICKEMLM